jgi:HD-like signal output (HDOD) protein
MNSSEKKVDKAETERTPEKTGGNNAKAEDKKILQEAIARIVKKVKSGEIELPVLPNVIQEIQRVMSEPNANVDNLAEVIEKDAVVSLKVISAANSPFYRGTEKIRTVDMAISRLGFKETQSIVNVIANKGLYETKNTQFRTLMEKLWLHSLATAYGSRILSNSLALGETEKYFLMGLIHDIGKTLLLKVLGNLHPQIESLEIEDIITSVQDIHTGFGGAIIRRWGFSEEYIRVTLLHEGPNFSENTDKDVLLINIANNIAHNLQFCAYHQDPIDLMGLEAVKYLGVESEIIDSTIENVTSLMEETATIF